MPKQVTIAGKALMLTPKDFEQAVQRLKPPETGSMYSVTIGGRRFSPKHVVSEVFGLGLSQFTTADALRAVRAFGFSVDRETADGRTGRLHRDRGRRR